MHKSLHKHAVIDSLIIKSFFLIFFSSQMVEFKRRKCMDSENLPTEDEHGMCQKRWIVIYDFGSKNTHLYNFLFFSFF
jgi:hypothetical protein